MEKDFLDGWREATRKYEGDCEYDATAEAIKAYLRYEQEKKEQEKKEQEKKSKDEGLEKQYMKEDEPILIKVWEEINAELNEIDLSKETEKNSKLDEKVSSKKQGNNSLFFY